jgi:hypothetical protein
VKHVRNWEGFFDRRRWGIERVNSSNRRVYIRGGEKWGQQFHERFTGSSKAFAEETLRVV